MDGKTKIVSRGGKMTMRYRSMAKMGPEITGVKRSCNIPVFSRKECKFTVKAV